MHDDTPSPLRTLAWRAALGAAAGWLGWRIGGVKSIALTAPLFAVAVAGPLLETAGEALRLLRGRALAGVEGHYYAYRGRRVRVFEDSAHNRWVHAGDVRSILDAHDSDHALALSHGDGVRMMGCPAAAHLGEDALLAYLAHHGTPTAWQLQQWARRVVVGPARERRRRGAHATTGSAPGTLP